MWSTFSCNTWIQTSYSRGTVSYALLENVFDISNHMVFLGNSNHVGFETSSYLLEPEYTLCPPVTLDFRIKPRASVFASNGAALLWLLPRPLLS